MRNDRDGGFYDYVEQGSIEEHPWICISAGVMRLKMPRDNHAEWNLPGPVIRNRDGADSGKYVRIADLIERCSKAVIYAASANHPALRSL